MTGRMHDASVLMPSNADTTLRHRVIRTLGQSSISICIHSYPRQASGSIQRRPSENEDQDGNGDICFGRSGGVSSIPNRRVVSWTVCSCAYEQTLDILGSIFTMDGVGASFSCYES